MKRSGYIPRKTGLKPGGPLRRRRKPNKAKVAAARERHPDGHGIYFDEVRLWLPDRVSDWPVIRRVESPVVRATFRHLWYCALCGELVQCDPHHLTGGTKGRSDELCNLIELCRSCHDEIQSQPDDYRRVWLAKWKSAPTLTDWVRLVLLLGRWPDFESLDPRED